jgi:hypothetical protein
MCVDHAGHGRDFTQIDHLSVVVSQNFWSSANPHKARSVDHKRTVIDR